MESECCTFESDINVCLKKALLLIYTVGNFYIKLSKHSAIWFTQSLRTPRYAFIHVPVSLVSTMAPGQPELMTVLAPFVHAPLVWLLIQRPWDEGQACYQKFKCRLHSLLCGFPYLEDAASDLFTEGD